MRTPQVLTGSPPVDSTATELAELFGLRDCWYEPFPFDAQLPRIEPGRIVLPAHEPGVAPWRTDTAIELPVRLDNGLTLGRFILMPSMPTIGVHLPVDRRARAIALAESMAPAIAASLQ